MRLRTYMILVLAKQSLKALTIMTVALALAWIGAYLVMRMFLWAI